MNNLQSKKSPERVKSAKFTSLALQNDDNKQPKEKKQNIESTSTSKASLRSTNINNQNDDENKKSRKQRNNSKGSQSRSPDYQTNPKQIGTKKSSSKSPRRKPKSSKSPKRKQTGKRSSGRNDESSMNFTTSLTEFPKSTAELEDLSSQGLTLINAKIFQKYTLRKLILSSNNLRSIPTAISGLSNLEYLDLSKNPLKVRDVDDSHCLPVEMRLLKQLIYLNISECNLRHIPTTVWMCVSIRNLDLSRNKISLLVPEVGNLQNLMRLNLSQCNLTTLPAEIGFCSSIEEIILMANQIDMLPETLKDCKNLKILKMSYRSFNILLDSYMENLISKGQIKSEHIPIVTFELENLRVLDLKHTKINNLPENNLKNLKELYLDWNYFDNFTQQQNVMQSIIAPPISSSTNISQLTDYPPLSTIAGSSLSVVSTSGNSTQPPASILSIMSTNLTILTLSNNLFKEIPQELMCLTNLEILDLSFNMISKLPKNLNLLIRLKELYLNNNCLFMLHNSIGALKNLTKLTLNNNEIIDFYEEPSRNKNTISSLARKSLSNENKIACLPESLFELNELNYLDLSYNKLTQISPKICNLLNIKQAHSYDKLNNKIGLWLIGNPLKIPPKQIWQTQNIKKIFSYLASYTQRNLNYVYYSKLIFLGKTSVGKSQLIDSFFMNGCLPSSQQKQQQQQQQQVESFSIDDLNKDIEDDVMVKSQLLANDENDITDGGITNRSNKNQRISSMNASTQRITSRDLASRVSSKSKSATKQDYRTRIARKFYKRTLNKVEWLIIDLAGESIYRPIHSTFFASIDHQNEPTIFVLTYNHLDYSLEKHDEYLGTWIESILMHTRVLTKSSETEQKEDFFTIQIKLVGVIMSNEKDDHLSLEEHYLSTASVIENCQMTFNRVHEKLVAEKVRVEKLISTLKDDDNNLKYLREAKKNLDILLKRKINLNENVLLYDFSLNKECSENLSNELELITIQFNKIAPLDLKNALRDHLIKYRKSSNSNYSPCSSSLSNYSANDLNDSFSKIINSTNWLNLEDFIQSLKASKEISNILKTNTFCNDLTLVNVVDYAKTIGEIFWLKYNLNSNLNKRIFLKFDYIINCLQLFIKHDKTLVEYDSTMGYFRGHSQFTNSMKLAKTYGIIENSLIKSICFTPQQQLTQQEIDNALTLLSDFLFVYKSSLEPTDKNDQYKLDEKMESYFSIVCPTMCSISFDREKSIRSKMENYWESDLYSKDSYELFFDKLDQINMYREKIRLANGIKKETIMYNLQDILNGNDYYKDQDNNKNKKQDLTLINLDSIVKKEFMMQKPIIKNLDQNNDDEEGDDEDEDDEINRLQSLLNESNKLKFFNKCIIECKSPFRFERHLFNHFSVLVQTISSERFDWDDTIIARNVDNSCFKIQLLNNTDNTNLSGNDNENKIKIELKCLSQENLDKLKKQFLKLIDELFCYYPGLYFFKNIVLLS